MAAAWREVAVLGLGSSSSTHYVEGILRNVGTKAVRVGSLEDMCPGGVVEAVNRSESERPRPEAGHFSGPWPAGGFF